MAQLKAELAARNLDQKGLKNALAERLQQAIDAEREKEAAGDVAAPITGELLLPACTCILIISADDATKTSEQGGKTEAQKTAEVTDSAPEVRVDT